eukprot:2883220-Lingulodinium_polyedra.AAC.1
MVAVKRAKPDRSLMISWMQTAEAATETECIGLYRWFVTLRVGCTKVQLPVAVKCLEFVARFHGSKPA